MHVRAHGAYLLDGDGRLVEQLAVLLLLIVKLLRKDAPMHLNVPASHTDTSHERGYHTVQCYPRLGSPRDRTVRRW